MSHKKRKSHENHNDKVIILVTAILGLIAQIIELIIKLLD